MKIYEKPDNWKDLQSIVGKILTECNFKVEIEKKIQSSRSIIEIDVFAEEVIDDRIYTILCECKMWKTNIPQLYVHSLRTVVNDIGANKGYIISTSDFQIASINSIKNTNIELITWDKFQKNFFKSWYFNFFFKKLSSIIKSDYDPIRIQFFENFKKIEKKKFRNLIDKYYDLQIVLEHFPSYILKDFNVKENFENRLPLKEKLNLEDWELDNLCLSREILEETVYSNFLQLIEDFAEPIYKELDKLNLNFHYE